ncbi:arsenate reductase ArsC [Mycobacterium intracellulare]|uniref:arsenate reductase ArsC n=1 Tax=Mycobacterium intracellulare TaxID=1767 RepID=UPI001F52AFA7|nr:arsenate reductase ArsC [Mycobacterium intracellulare]
MLFDHMARAKGAPGVGRQPHARGVGGGGFLAERGGSPRRRSPRQRLHALARVEGKISDGKPTVLFLCTHNAGRSQMALGFFTHLAGDNAIAWSGGSEPGNEINPAAIEAMHEVGIDITGEYPKPWTDEIVQAADVVITMGCGDACPIFPGKRYENWELPDPAGQGLDAVRPIRDDIEERIHRLLTDLNVPITR